jgi:hypothetical protein
MLALQTLPEHSSFHGLPGLAGTATCLHSALAPGPRVDSAWSPGQAQPICVCVRACDATSSVLRLGPRIHMGTHAHTGLGMWPLSSCLSWALCKHFCACWVGGTLKGPGSKPAGSGAPAGQGSAPGLIQAHDHHTCLVCSFHLHPFPGSRRTPTTHISCCTPRGCSCLSCPVSVHICLSYAALLPPTQGQLTAPP